MQIGFICPDGGRCTHEECFTECRIADQFPAGRCLAKRNLKLIGETRPWKGKPSVTQLQKGTREAYLEIKQPYFIDPQSAIFRIIGTKGHAELDKYTGSGELGEIRLELHGITGQFDYLDEEGNLYDTKLFGSYKLASCLGLKTVDVLTDEVYKTGPKKGQRKTRKQITQGEPNIKDQTLQLNMYRMMLEDAGFSIKGLYLDVNCRDGGILAAINRGITQNAYLIKIPTISDQEVIDFFIPRKDALLTALKSDTLPPPCTDEERWSGRKCSNYCNVWEGCDVGRKTRGIKCRD